MLQLASGDLFKQSINSVKTKIATAKAYDEEINNAEVYKNWKDLVDWDDYFNETFDELVKVKSSYVKYCSISFLVLHRNCYNPIRSLFAPADGGL